jgi:GTP-binding protein EngB required for normal cell division
MKHTITMKYRGIAQPIIAPLAVLVIGMMSSCNLTSGVPATPNVTSYDETVVFFGNPGAGKSALCNSIFQDTVFQSGLSTGTGLTREKQAFIYQHTKYIDTPGLSDVDIPAMERAAQEIEKALKENDSYKIIFVSTLESGRIRKQDLVTINKICEAVKVKFKYGIIFNKATEAALASIRKNPGALEGYLTTLTKQPASIDILEEEEAMDNGDRVFMAADSENRKKLLNFIANLEANMIPANQVAPIDVTDYEDKVEKMGKRLADLREENNMYKDKISDIKKKLDATTIRLENLSKAESEQKSNFPFWLLAGAIATNIIVGETQKDKKEPPCQLQYQFNQPPSSNSIQFFSYKF